MRTIAPNSRRRIRGGVTAARSQPGRVQPHACRPGPWQRLRAHRHPGAFGSHDPPPTARLGRARRRCGTAQSRARRLRPNDRPRPRRPLIGWVDHQTLGGHRRARHPPRPGRRRRQPARLTPVRTHHAPDPGHDRTATRPTVGAPRPRLRLHPDPAPARRTRLRPRDRPQTHPRPIQAGKRWVVEHRRFSRLPRQS